MATTAAAVRDTNSSGADDAKPQIDEKAKGKTI